MDYIAAIIICIIPFFFVALVLWEEKKDDLDIKWEEKQIKAIHDQLSKYRSII